jgi:hypothetical protein
LKSERTTFQHFIIVGFICQRLVGQIIRFSL